MYDYNKNITVTTTPHGDKVITMNGPIFNKLLNDISDAHMHQQGEGLDTTAKDTIKLWQALANKEETK